MPKPRHDNGTGLQSFYCVGCGHFLNVKGQIVQGVMMVQCHSCKEWTTISDAQQVLALPGLDKSAKKG